MLQMPSEQFVCFFKRSYLESDQCCGEEHHGISQVGGRLRDSVLEAAFAGSFGSASIIWLMPK